MSLLASLPSYVKNLKPYQAGVALDEMLKRNKRVTKLASNENPFGPSPLAVEEMEKCLREVNHYPDMNGEKLKEAIAQFHGLQRDNIVLGNGSEGVLSCIARTFLAPKDKILMPKHSFIGMFIIAKGLGIRLETVPFENFDLSLEEIKNQLPDLKILYIANPDNPTGRRMNKKQWENLMNVVPESTLVVMDEAYFEFARDDEDYPDSINCRYDNVITLRTFSKAYGLAGIRIGYGLANKEIIHVLNKMRLPFEPNHVAQRGAVGALQDDIHVKKTVENNKRQYERLFSFLTERHLDPLISSANFITHKTHSRESSVWMYERLLDMGVAVRPLMANGMPEFIRVSLGTEEMMNHYFTAMEEILPSYEKLFGR